MDMNNILVELKIPNKFLTVSLKEYDVDEDTMITIGISPKLRLRRKLLYIDDLDLAVEFEHYLEEKFQKRDFKNNYELELIPNCVLNKSQLRWQKDDSDKIREVLKGRKFDSQLIESRREAIEDNIDDKTKFIYFIKNTVKNERTASDTINFYLNLHSVGYDWLKRHKAKSTFKKYTKILNSLGLEEEDMRALYRPTPSSKPNLRIL